MGRHRADSEDRQRHDDGPRHPAPKPAAEDLGKGRTASAGIVENGTIGTSGTTIGTIGIMTGAGTAVDGAATPGGAAALRPRRNPSRSTPAAAAKPASPKTASPKPASPKTASPKTVRRNHDLLGWGLFLAATASAAMVWAGIDWTVTAVCGFLLLLSFVAVWYVSSTPPAAPVEQAPAKPVPAKGAPKDASPVKDTSPVKESTPVKDASPVKQPAPVKEASSVKEASPAKNEESAEAPLTRKQMRAADPTTGVMPVVSVFARKPASGTSPARTASSATEPPVPSAPAGQLLQGIDTGAPAPDSRRARRAAAAAASAAAKKKTAGKTAAVSKAEPVSTSEPVAKAEPASPAAAETPAKGSPAGAAGSDETTDSAATAENADAESRWTRVFGPPETGQLPVQRYVPAATAVEPNAGSAERQQRSHSSL